MLDLTLNFCLNPVNNVGSGHLGHAQQEGPGGQGVPHEQLYPNLSNANLWNVLRAPGVPNPNL